MKKAVLLVLVVVSCSAIAQAQSLQKVLIEEFTGAWCGYCPDGALILEDVLQQHPNAIAASLHNGDGMYNALAGTIQSYYSPAYPQATINRQSNPISRGSWNSAVTTALQMSPVVVVAIDSAGYNSGTRTLKVKVKASFLRDTVGRFRFNVYLTEDGVIGSGTGYDQTNYYNSNVGSPLYGLGNPIPNYEHNHVFRDAMGGAWGTANYIPDTVHAGEDYFLTYTKVLSANWNTANMNIIGMVNMHTSPQRPTLNAEVVPFSFATSIGPDPVAAGMEMSIFPNPLQTRSTISFNLEETGRVRIEVYSITGQRVARIADDVTNAGMHSVIWEGMDGAGQPVANGLYIVRLTTESGAQIAHRLLVDRH